jgi:glutamate N-acetyltransferase/amino-acid N-acetyltransferase
MANNPLIENTNDERLKGFEEALHSVLLNLAKRVAADGEGASKFISVTVKNTKTQEDAKKICFSISNSPLVKTAIAGEDPNWGRIVMALGKANVSINLNKLSIKIGSHKVIEKGNLYNNYNEEEVANYMKDEKIDLLIDIGVGKKTFTTYTMDLTKKYIEINTDYRT